MPDATSPSPAVPTVPANGFVPGEDLLTLGLLAGSSMENERRLPIHPRHLDQIDPDLRARMIVERGYGDGFRLEPGYVESRVGRVAERSEVLRAAEVLLLPKPQAADVAAVPAGRVLWGWPHCVQDAALTQQAIDSRLTLIAFEAMNHWTQRGDTCSTRTTSSPATAPCCTHCGWSARPVTTGHGSARSSSASVRRRAVP